MQQISIVDLYDNEIRPKLSNHIPEIFASLNPVDKGSHYVCICPNPNCSKREAFIYKAADRLICNRRNNCQHSISILEHLNGGTYPKGKDYVDIIKRLCEMTGTTFPEREYSPEEIQRFEQQEKKQNLLEDFQDIVSMALLDGNLGANARKYLAERGFPAEILKDYEFGFYPSARYIQDKLQQRSHLQSNIKEAGVFCNNWDGRITYPLRHRRKIGDYWARDITGTVKKELRYLRMSGTSSDDTSILFGLDDCDSKEIIVVEGYFDALTLWANGIKNAVALGNSKLSDAHITKLENHNTKSITLLLDNDKTGKDDRITIINKLANHDIDVYVVQPELLGDSKDIDEYVKTSGKEAAQSLLNNSIDGFRYHAQYIVIKYKNGDDWKDKELKSALDAALKFNEKVTNHNRDLQLDFFWGEFINLTGIEQDTVDKYKKDIREKEAAALKEKLIKDSRQATDKLLAAGDFVAAAAEAHKLSSKLKEHEYSQDKTLAELVIPDSMDEMYEAFKNEIPSIETGYKITEDISFSFPAGGVSIVAGPTGGGKTTVLMNAVLGVLEQNPDLTMYFCSYEESEHHIRAKFINTYANVPLNSGNNRGSIYHFFNKGGEHNQDAFKYISHNKDPFLAKMKEFNERFIATGRLKIINKEMPVEELIHAIEYISQQKPNARMFVIDYIQQLETSKATSNTARYEELKDIAVMFRQCATQRGLAIVLGAQLKREVDEESKLHKNAIADGHGIAKEAAIVYGLWNRSNNDEREEVIVIKVLKGRNVREGDFAVMPFNGNTGKIGDDAFVNDKRNTTYGTAPVLQDYPNTNNKNQNSAKNKTIPSTKKTDRFAKMVSGEKGE